MSFVKASGKSSSRVADKSSAPSKQAKLQKNSGPMIKRAVLPPVKVSEKENHVTIKENVEDSKDTHPYEETFEEIRKLTTFNIAESEQSTVNALDVELMVVKPNEYVPCESTNEVNDDSREINCSAPNNNAGKNIIQTNEGEKRITMRDDTEVSVEEILQRVFIDIDKGSNNEVDNCKPRLSNSIPAKRTHLVRGEATPKQIKKGTYNQFKAGGAPSKSVPRTKQWNYSNHTSEKTLPPRKKREDHVVKTSTSSTNHANKKIEKRENTHVIQTSTTAASLHNKPTQHNSNREGTNREQNGNPLHNAKNGSAAVTASTA